MLSNIFFILKDFQSVPEFPVDKRVFFSILTGGEYSDLTKAYNLIKDSTYKVSVTVLLDRTFSNDTIQLLTSIFFLNSYKRIENKVVINIIYKEKTMLEQSANLLTIFLKNQGLNEPVINAIGYNSLFDSRPTEPSETIVRQYEESLKKGEVEKSFFYVGHEYVSVYKDLNFINEKFQKENPALFKTLSNLLEIKEAHNRIAIRNQYLEIELKYQLEYNSLLRNNHLSAEIQNHYNNEYEVLPGWYKRFGHILKVIYGKRTFSSLFSDKVKKYK